jgi:hypothetical protein
VSYEFGKIVNGKAGHSVVEETSLTFGIGPCEEISTEFGTVVSDSMTETFSVESVFDCALKIDSVPGIPLDVPGSMVSRPSVTFGPFVPASLSDTSTMSTGTPVLISKAVPNSVESNIPPVISDAESSVISSVVGLAAGCSVTICCSVNSLSLNGLVDESLIVDVMMVDGSETYPFDSSTLSEIGI